MIKAVIFDMYETLITHFASPFYFGLEIAQDIGIDPSEFLPLWRGTEDKRTTGELPMDKALESILKTCNIFSDDLLKHIMDKRVEIKEDCFRHLHNEIIPMLELLKKSNIKIALISNCFTEEAMVIRNSILAPYFDEIILSCEQGIKKPDPQIFLYCLEKLKLKPEECIYVGDGGSNELDAASTLGIRPIQACWYLIQGSKQPVWYLPEFDHLERPMDISKYI